MRRTGWGWVVPWRNQGIVLHEFPALKAWFERISARDPVQRGFKLGAELRAPLQASRKDAEESRKLLFGWRVRA